MNSRPIIIGGLSYSGKTYLRLMLLAQPGLSITRRSKMWPRYYKKFGDLSNAENLETCLQAMLKSPAIRELNPDLGRIRSEFCRGQPTYGNLFALFHMHHAQRQGKSRWGDQLGGVENYAGPILSAYPDARLIHMIRDPRSRSEAAIGSSRHRQARLGWEIAAWRHSAKLARQNKSRFPEQYLLVHYEALLSQPEQSLRQICTFIGEQFMPEMLTVPNVPGLPHGMTEMALDPTKLDNIGAREMAMTQRGTAKERMLLAYKSGAIPLTLEDYLMLPLLDWPLNLAGQTYWWLKEGHS